MVWDIRSSKGINHITNTSSIHNVIASSHNGNLLVSGDQSGIGYIIYIIQMNMGYLQYEMRHYFHLGKFTHHISWVLFQWQLCQSCHSQRLNQIGWT